MSPEDLYDAINGKFPSLWPQLPQWSWVNVHDGREPKVRAISEMLAQVFESPELIVLVHSTPGIAVEMPTATAAQFVAKFVLQHEVQVADPGFRRFVTVAISGVATSDA